MADELRWGILGLGMGRNRANAAAKTAGVKLACVCSIEPGKAEAVGKELGCDWTTDYEEMFAREDLDVIGVMSPSGMHCDFVIQALQAGKHVHTTKPMDIRVEKCDAAIAAAKKAGKILAVDFDSRYNPANHQLRAAIQSGKLGKVFSCDLLMKWYRAQSYYDGGSPAGWRSRKATEGGSIANQGVHFIDLIQWFLGPVESVYGKSGTFNHQIETEDQTMALLTYKSGAWGIVHTTTCSTPDLGSVIEINGTQGTILWKDNQVTLYKSEVDPESKLENFPVDPNLPKNIIEDLASAITKGTPVQCSGEEGRKSVQIFTAIYESSNTGKAVAIK